MGIDEDALTAALPGLLRYATWLTRDPADAEDLVQDTVLRALERGEGFRGESAAATWLHTVMHRRFLDTVRRRGAEPTDDDALLDAVEAAWRDDAYTVDPEVVLARAETRDRLRDALVHLPVILRSAVLLHDLEGMTSREVAEVHGIGVPAAKQRLRRGRALLVSLLAEDEERRAAMAGVPMRCWEARSRVGDYLDDDLPLGALHPYASKRLPSVGDRARHVLESHRNLAATSEENANRFAGVLQVLEKQVPDEPGTEG